jgi:hypothetical protein
MARVAAQPVARSPDVVGAEIVAARIINPTFIGDKIVDGRIVDGKLVSTAGPGRENFSTQNPLGDSSHPEVIAILGLGLAILLMKLL